jgi:osmoprotectant transport system permease protein
MTKRLLSTCLGLLLALFGMTGPMAAADAQKITIGSKTFTESVILGEILGALVSHAGYEAEHRKQLGGTRILWNALLRGDIHIYPEYTGTIAREILADKNLSRRSDIHEALARQGISMSWPLGFNNTYAIGVKPSLAKKRGLATISDLAKHRDLRLGFSNEFMDRADGWPALQRTYKLRHDKVKGLDHDLAYRGLQAGDIDAMDVYTTDAEIAYYGLRLLADDRRHFPAYDAVILYRTDLRRTAPDAVNSILRLEGRIGEERMSGLNAAVKISGKTESAVATDFLQKELGIEHRAADETPWSRFWRHTLEHLTLVCISLAAAILIAIPLGITAARHSKFGQMILAAVAIIQTIPGLALLVFMIPLLGIGTYPAIAALFLYSLLPIVRNTHSGLTTIPESLRESATALGMEATARLRLVELPLAAPAILAGIKTAAVINVGTATLGALIGAGGYGQPILTGIRLDDVGLILEGAVPAALLALAVQGGFELAERRVVPPGMRAAPQP